ncbi:MAG: DUF5074 domain-containing protein [Rikenellaceae bacterium]
MIAVVLFLISVFASCHQADTIVGSTSSVVTDGQDGEIKGFFLLNEGNYGSNKATLDYFDYTTGVYHKNIFAERNPMVVSELGDVGNDIKIWGDRLFAVINASNLVEVMDVETAEHITAVSIPNCRYIAFCDNYAYVSSYAGAVELDPNARKGYVAKIDLDTFEIVAECTVGYQPEELVVVGERLYVANSGGYMSPNYDSTVSVVDLNSFEVVGEIEVAINLHRMRGDDYGKLWISSRGDYSDTPSMTYTIDTATDEVTQYPLLSNTNMALSGDNLYICSSEYSKAYDSYTMSYALVDAESGRTISRNFVDEAILDKIVVPYGIAVNPYNNEIFITDAGDYVTPGKVYCFDAEGNYKWDATTGDVPAHIVFTNDIEL